MTDQPIPAWLREEAEKVVNAILEHVDSRCGCKLWSECRAAMHADAAAFALRVGARLAQEALVTGVDAVERAAWARSYSRLKAARAEIEQQTGVKLNEIASRRRLDAAARGEDRPR